MDAKQKAVIELLNIVFGIPLKNIKNIELNYSCIYIDYIDGDKQSLVLMDCED